MKIIFLGTASGLPTQDRFCQTIVIERGSELHILDPADGASYLMARLGLDHRSIRSALISHMHADHHSGLAQLMKTAMHLKKEGTLDLLMPSEGIDPVKRFLVACYLPPEWLGYPVNTLAIESDPLGRTYNIGESLQVLAYPNDHLQRFRRNGDQFAVDYGWKFESFSFVLLIDGKRIVYSGNLRQDLDEIAHLLKPGDILITETAHLKPLDILETVKRVQLQHTYLVHFNPSLDMNLLWEDVRREGMDDFITLAHDGLTVDLED